MRDRLVGILIVEDNPADVLLIREALKMNDIQKGLNVVPDGVKPWLFSGGRTPMSKPPSQISSCWI